MLGRSRAGRRTQAAGLSTRYDFSRGTLSLGLLQKWGHPPPGVLLQERPTVCLRAINTSVWKVGMGTRAWDPGQPPREPSAEKLVGGGGCRLSHPPLAWD